MRVTDTEFVGGLLLIEAQRVHPRLHARVGFSCPSALAHEVSTGILRFFRNFASAKCDDLRFSRNLRIRMDLTSLCGPKFGRFAAASTEDAVKDDHAAIRVRRRLRAWVAEQGHGSRLRIARAVSSRFGARKSASWATDILRDGHNAKLIDLRLRDLDAVADVLGVPPGELVARDGNHYIEARPSELKLVRYFRSLPVDVQKHMMAYLDFLHEAHERELTVMAQQRDEITERAKRKGIA